MSITNSYIIIETSSNNTIEVIESFDTNHGSQIALDVRKNKFPSDAAAMSVVEVEVIDVETSFDKEIGSTVVVEAKIDGKGHKAEFTVQVSETGDYESQNGCWITCPLSNGDFDFTNNEAIIFASINVVALAESVAKQALDAKYNYTNAFKQRINGIEVQIREDNEDGSAILVLRDMSWTTGDYGFEIKELDYRFDSVDEAEAFVAEFANLSDFLNKTPSLEN